MFLDRTRSPGETLRCACFNGAAFSRTRKLGLHGCSAIRRFVLRFNGAAFSRTRKHAGSIHGGRYGRPRTCFNGGRVLTNAETKLYGSDRGWPLATWRFNGAAFSRTRKLTGIDGQYARNCRFASMGPRSHERGNRAFDGRELGSRPCRAASMGPRSHERGNSVFSGLAIVGPRQVWSFNGAAFSRTRKRPKRTVDF